MPIHMLLGQITLTELLPTDEFTIAVNDEKLYQRILKRPLVSLKANLYIMLVNLERVKILKEEKISAFHFKGQHQ